MREGITVEVSAADRARLRAIVADRDSPRKHAWRAAIILATAEGRGTAEIMRRAGVSKPCVWRWQARFMAEGVDGLLRDKTRPPGTPPLPAATVERVVGLTLAESGVKRNIPGRRGNALAGNQNPGWGDVRRDASDVRGAGAAGRVEGRGAELAGARVAARPGGLDDQPRAPGSASGRACSRLVV